LTTEPQLDFSEGVAAPTPANEMRGLRAGAVIFAGIAGANIANYVFQLLCGRSLGPRPYGDVVTLSVVTGLLSLPLGGIQVSVARTVARRDAGGHRREANRYLSGFTAACGVAGVAAALILLVLTPLLQDALAIGTRWAVIFTALFAAPSLVAPPLIGALQGRQRFTLLALALAGPPFLRVALVAVALSVGLGVTAAMAATFASAVAAILLPLFALRHDVPPIRRWRPHVTRPEFIDVLPVVGGLLAITALTSDDLLVAKASFSGHEAGLYGSASLIGKLILFLPAAIVTVLLPKVASRVASRRSTADIFVQSLGVTVVFCVALTLIYGAIPHFIVAIAYGPKYLASAPLLWLFGVAMTLYAVLNLLLTYDLGHGQSRTSVLLLGGALVQGLFFVFFHGSPHQLLAIDIVVAFRGAS